MAHPLSQYRVIRKEEHELMCTQLRRAIRYCRDAQSTRYDDEEQDPTATYPGASGYAGSCMTAVLSHLESAIDCANLFEEAN